LTNTRHLAHDYFLYNLLHYVAARVYESLL